MSSPESLEALEGLEGLSAQEIQELNQLNQQQADVLNPGMTSTDEVENAKSDFSVTAGRKLEGIDGEAVDADDEEKRRLAGELTGIESADKTKVHKLAKQSEYVVKEALGGIDIDVNKVGGSSELLAQLETDFAQKGAKQQEASGAAELSPTQAKELRDTVLEETARETIRALHESPDVRQQLIENDPELASHLAPFEAINAQNDGLSELAAKQAGEEIFKSKGGNSDVQLPKAA
ncbi:hypothetical protein KDA00_01905 [Candidatus Saccharibacteria bacterium]|nr:hypothetical protein [Candidatus Saccharibacteria bacterium]